MNMHKSLVAVLGLILISSTASAATVVRVARHRPVVIQDMSEHVQLRMHGHNVKTMFPHPCSPVCHESKNQHKPPPVPQP